MPQQSAFKSAPYRRYFPAAIFSTLGGWTLRFLLGWSAWDITHSATWVGVVCILDCLNNFMRFIIINFSCCLQQ